MSKNRQIKNIKKFVKEYLSRLEKKNDEYASGGFYDNFITASELQQKSMQDVIMSYNSKHIVSIYDMVQKPIDCYTEEQWDEKIGDAICYLLILRSYVKDSVNSEDPVNEANFKVGIKYETK